MRRMDHRRTGGAWAIGFGLLSLVVVVAIIMYLVSLQTDSMVSSTGGRGPKAVIDEQKARIEGFSQRNVELGNTVAEEANKMFQKPAPAPAPTPAPVVQTPPAAPAPAPAPAPAAPTPIPSGSGTPSGGTPIGPISPITPLAPIHEGPAPNLRPATRPIDNVNKAMDERNKELEKALNGG